MPVRPASRLRPRPFRLAVLACALLPLAALAGDRITGADFATRSEVIAPHAMAATSQPLATQIALDVMKQGGSAVDAAIAANAALGLMEPTGNGVGGDLFAIVWDPKTQKLYGYNGSGRSPKSLTLAEFQRRGLKDIPPTGPLPVSVPGTVDAWFALHDRFGRRPMADNLAPAIRYAREGHPVAETIAYYWDRSVPRLSQYPGFKEQFTIDGHAPRKGELWKNPNLAHTLQQIADGGRDAFYKGDIARTIDSYFKANGGFLSYDDLASHHGEWVEPVSSNYRGYDVWELPPNSQGIAALQILNILEGYDFSKIPFGSPEHVHLFVEAKKLAFADRARFYADPAFQKAPVAKLISKPYAAERRKLISMDKALKEVQPGTPKQLEEGDTIYMTVADADGMMVSLIQSNYRGMGSGMAPPGLGFILQDRGEMFVLKKDHPNGYAPGEASVPDHHPGLHHQGRPAVHELRRDGRGDAAAGPRPDRDEPGRFPHEPAGSRRRPAHPARRLDRADRPGNRNERRWRGQPGERLLLRHHPRADAQGPPRDLRRRPVWRLPGDHARRQDRGVLRRVGESQGWAGGGVLRKATDCEKKKMPPGSPAAMERDLDSCCAPSLPPARGVAMAAV